jgi:hypothetical protein
MIFGSRHPVPSAFLPKPEVSGSQEVPWPPDFSEMSDYWGLRHLCETVSLCREREDNAHCNPY